jgi:hypothetical protein
MIISVEWIEFTVLLNKKKGRGIPSLLQTIIKILVEIVPFINYAGIVL